MAKALRYVVGNHYLFVRVVRSVLNYHSCSFTAYVPFVETSSGMETVLLCCTKHERVPSNVSDVIEHDGFQFIDKDGHVWNNQYPRAIDEEDFGELNWMVTRKGTKTGANPATWWMDASVLLMSLNYGTELEVPDSRKLAALLECSEELAIAILDQYGRRVVYGPKSANFERHVIAGVESVRFFQKAPVMFEPPF